MTTQRAVMAVVVAMACAWPVAGRQRIDAEVLFETALHQEQVELRLEEAIASYKRVVASAGSNEVLAAKALLHMAGCYERLGKPEARATYELIVRKYAADRVVADAARAKLATLGQKGAALTDRKVWDQVGYGVSPDGRLVAFTDWDTGDIAVHDLTTGRNRRLTSHGKDADYGDGASFSPDGRSLAYTWHKAGTGTSELRVVPRDGGQPRTVLTVSDNASVWAGWTPDNRSLLVSIDRGPTAGPWTRELSFVRIDTGEKRVVKQFEFAERKFQMNPALSPDGRFIAYNLRQSPGARERDIVVLSLDTGRETLLVKHPADDDCLGWLPSGGGLLFASDRTGSYGIWAVRTVDGHPDEPVLIKMDTGDVVGIGATRNGFFYQTASSTESEVYIATLDDAGTLSGQLARLEGRFVGQKVQAVWSPDGNRIVYQQTQNTRVMGPLVIQTISSGTVKVIPLALQVFQNPAWFPDGRSIVVQGITVDGQQGLHMVNIETGMMSTLARQKSPSDGIIGLAQPTPDGGYVFFKSDMGISVHEIVSGAERKILAENTGAFSLSGDGQWLAVLTPAGSPGSAVHLSLVSSSGGATRPLAPSVTNWVSGIAPAWSVDGKFLFVVRRGPRSLEVWRVPVDGSAPKATGISWSGGLARISAHPDGHRLAISTAKSSAETWVLENLPTLHGK